MIDENRLRKASTSVLSFHLGVAAEFVVDDALVRLRLAKLDANQSDETKLRFYLMGMSGLVDRQLPFEQIRQHILATYSNASKSR